MLNNSRFVDRFQTSTISRDPSGKWLRLTGAGVLERRARESQRGDARVGVETRGEQSVRAGGSGQTDRAQGGVNRPQEEAAGPLSAAEEISLAS